jgi:hypothetical protein
MIDRKNCWKCRGRENWSNGRAVALLFNEEFLERVRRSLVLYGGNKAAVGKDKIRSPQ